jgi:putative proteasome-type protease
MTCDTLYRGAQLVGEAMREVQKRDRAEIEAQGSAADATIIMAGQRKGGELRLFLIYTAGNFIEALATTRPTCRSASTSMASPSSIA